MRQHKGKIRLMIGGVLFGALAGLVHFLSPEDRPAPGTLPQPEKTVAATVKGVQIFGTGWGRTLAADGTGFYNDLVTLTLDGLPVSYTVSPYRRAKAVFLRGNPGCLYPSNIPLLIAGGEIDSSEGYIDTDGFLTVKVFVFSRPGTAPPASIHDIDHRSVAYAMGSRVPYFLKDANADFIAVADETDKARMLLSGRVDLISAALPDAKFVFDELGQPLPPFDPTYKLNDTLVRITCHDTPENRAFVQAFNNQLGDLRKTGALAALFEQAGLDVTLYLPGE